MECPNCSGGNATALDQDGEHDPSLMGCLDVHRGGLRLVVTVECPDCDFEQQYGFNGKPVV